MVAVFRVLRDLKFRSRQVYGKNTIIMINAVIGKLFYKLQKQVLI